jgi:hypothetical protein
MKKQATKARRARKDLEPRTGTEVKGGGGQYLEIKLQGAKVSSTSLAGRGSAE